MNQEIATLIIRIGAICGWSIWLVSVWFFRKMSRREPGITKDVESKQLPVDARKTLLRMLALQPQWRIRERTATKIKAIAMRVTLAAELIDVPAGTQCRIFVDFQRIDRIFVLWMRLILFGLAPLALLGIPEMLHRFVTANPVPAVQWQAVQIVQLIHVLWPPFLLYAMHTQMRSHFIRLMDQLVLMLEIES